MSLTFSLICKETKQRLWVGQGHHVEQPDGSYPPVMTTFYSGEPTTMAILHRFLCATQGFDLKLVCHEHQEDSFYEAYKEFT